MKFTCLLLLAGSLLVIDNSTLSSAPVQAVPNRSTQSPAASPYAACDASRGAVVTIYAGSEIGSGSIVASQGLVITNNHVVKQVVRSNGAKPIYVKLASGDRYRGSLLKTDVRNDLALIQLEAQIAFPTVPLANPQTIQPGQPVCAIGSPYGRPGIITQGKVNSIRQNGDLQSQVILKPGNSGGPLLNTRGEMVGVNRAILEAAGGRNTGISIATSIQAARDLIERSGFQVAAGSIYRSPAAQPLTPTIAAPLPIPAPRASAIVVPQPEFSQPTNAQLGVRLDTRNLVVQQVQSGSPAAVGGLRAGDRLLAVNGDRLSDFEELRAFLNLRPTAAIFTVSRDQRLATIRVSF